MNALLFVGAALFGAIWAVTRWAVRGGWIAPDTAYDIDGDP